MKPTAELGRQAFVWHVSY